MHKIFSATLVTNPDDTGITSNDDYSPLLFCDTLSVLNLTSPTDLCVAPTYPPVTDSWTTAGAGVTGKCCRGSYTSAHVLFN